MADGQDLNAEQNCACLPDHKFLCIRLIKQEKRERKYQITSVRARLVLSSPSGSLSSSEELKKAVGPGRKTGA